MGWRLSRHCQPLAVRGFSGGFALAPLLAPLLAEAVAHHSTLAEELGVDPARLLAQQDCPPPQEEGRGDSAS